MNVLMDILVTICKYVDHIRSRSQGDMVDRWDPKC